MDTITNVHLKRPLEMIAAVQTTSMYNRWSFTQWLCQIRSQLQMSSSFDYGLETTSANDYYALLSCTSD